ncbi:hypothetical protein JYT90_01145 [bacterium AH-315-P07]|nr:hypothetical protein [bacterium AH-315-P07]
MKIKYRIPEHVMLNESQILHEIEQYREMMSAFISGNIDEQHSEQIADNESEESRVSNLVAIGGALLHTFLFLGYTVSRSLGIQALVILFAKARISTDNYCYEPQSCSYNRAYTMLGLMLLEKNDIRGAVECLEASWQVHPCPHNMSYGLRNALAKKLTDYPEAELAVKRYEKIGSQFAYNPEKWDT